jgi:hypothetical protein
MADPPMVDAPGHVWFDRHIESIQPGEDLPAGARAAVGEHHDDDR